MQLNRWEKTAITVFVVLTGMRLFLSGYLGLGDDEAYYWDWSRHLQLSYYDHPAMVAWLIKAGTLIFGQTAFGVRIFGAISYALTGAILWKLALEMFKNRTTAAVTFLLYTTAPIFAIGGILMVPDAPMSIAWTAVTFLVWRILGEGENRWRTWILAGVVLGLGLISKYTIVLLAFSVVLLLLTEREWRKEFARPKLWVTMLIAALLCFPIIAWNIQYDWPTLKFHLHDRQTGGGGANFTRWGQYWASQAVALGPALFLVVLATGVVAARRFQDRRWRFLLVLSAPTFLIFTAQALYAEFKPHWPAPAYTLMFIGVAEWGRQGFGFAAQSTQKTARIAIAALVLAIVVPLNVVFHVGCVWPVIPKLARAFGAGATWEPKFDPTNDMYGWEKAAEEAKKIREEFAQRGERLPFLSSSRYQLVSQLAFVTQERVWRVSPGRDQYTFWQTDEDLNSIKGEPSIFITDNRFERDPRNDNIFESCEPRPPLDVYRGTELARRFHIYVCKGFRGIQ